MKILITRPEPAASRFADVLRSHGLTPVCAPLTEIVSLPVDHTALEAALSAADASVFTSQRAVTSFINALDGTPRADWVRALPAFSVGPATSQALRAAGWTDVRQGPGRAGELPTVVQAFAAHRSAASGPMRLTYPCGQTVAFDLAAALNDLPGIVCTPIEVYAARACAQLQMACATAINLHRPDAACTLSPEAAKLLTATIAASGLRPHSCTMVNYALSPAIAAALEPHDWRRIAVSPHPNSQEFVAFIVRDKPIP